MLLLGLDFETTWETPVDPNEARIIEVGAVLYDWERRSPTAIMSNFVTVPKEKIVPELTQLTGILPDDMDNGLPLEIALRGLNTLVEEADYVVAHNGNYFDKPVYESECRRQNIDPIKKPWVDTRSDILYPDHIKTRKLSHLAAEHGFANPFAHRALFDVMTMFKVMENYDLQEIIKRSQESTHLLTARVTYEDRQLAKDRGYFWNAEEKKWQKEVKQSEVAKEQNEAPFQVLEKQLEQ